MPHKMGDAERGDRVKQLERNLSEIDPGSGYVSVLVDNAEIASKKRPSRVLFTRLIRSMNKLTREMSYPKILELSEQPTDGALLINLVTQPELTADMAPISPELPSEQASAIGPEALLILSIVRGQEAKGRLLRAAGGTLTSQRVAQLLGGISRQAVYKRTKTQELLALNAGKRGYVYPSCQFTRNGVLTGLSEVLKTLHEDGWANLIFLLEPDEALGNRTPLQALRQGDLDAVLEIARKYGEQGGH